MMSGVPGVKIAWGHGSNIDSYLVEESTPKSGRDSAGTRDVTLTAEEKGQPRCKFCLTTTYSLRPEDSMRYDRKSC